MHACGRGTNRMLFVGAFFQAKRIVLMVVHVYTQ